MIIGNKRGRQMSEAEDIVDFGGNINPQPLGNDGNPPVMICLKLNTETQLYEMDNESMVQVTRNLSLNVNPNKRAKKSQNAL